MKAVLLMRDCILPAKDEVSAEARVGLRTLAQTDLLTILLCVAPDAGGSAVANRAAAAVDAVGGRIDAAVWCTHGAGAGCTCWGARPGLILEAANRFDLQHSDCYLIAASAHDVEMAVAAGVRPILVLQGRRIGEILGNSRERKDFPIARDLPQAVEYILAEERIAAQIGKPRQSLPPAPSEEAAHSSSGSLGALISRSAAPGEEAARPAASGPTIAAYSPAAISASRRVRMRPLEVGRWLSLLVVGGVWLSLGIAYLLTHLYRQQHFPQVAWYITLQFIPRVVRGVLFILTGVAVVVLASWNFWHTFGNGQATRRR